MGKFIIFAQPWWVNLLIFIPFIAYFLWKRKKIRITNQILIITTIFGIAFGFLEAAVIVYLRSGLGLLPKYAIKPSDIAQLPQTLFTIEIFREVATIIMLVSVAFLSIKTPKERSAIFLWVFAIWDIFYYASLKIAVNWPTSLLTEDVLFLIPVPWVSQVWFPILISFLTLLAVIFSRKNTKS